MDDELIHDIAVVFTDLRFSAGFGLGPSASDALRRILLDLDDSKTYLKGGSVRESMEARLRERLCPEI